MNSNVLKIAGAVITILGIIVSVILPGAYRDTMEKKYQDEITTTQATVMSVTVTSQYHRGGKGSKGKTTYNYKILAKADGVLMELLDHDDDNKNLPVEKNATITVYCLNDKYAYDSKDFYIMSQLGKTLMLIPMYVGLGILMVGILTGKKNY